MGVAVIPPFQKLQFSANDSATLRSDLLNKLGGGLLTLLNRIRAIIGEAEHVPLPDEIGVTVEDEGTEQGFVQRLNFTGAGVTATVSGDEATITIAGGGGGGTFLGATVDFGAGGIGSVSATIADAGVAADSKIVVSARPAAGRDVDEMEMGPVILGYGNIVPGVSFDVLAVSLDGDATGQYTVDCTRN